MIKKHLTEQTIIFASITKWIFYAAIIGALVGTIVTGFLTILKWSENAQNSLSFNHYLLLPFAFIFVSYIIKKFAPEAGGHGTESVIEAVHKRSGKIDIKVIPIKIFATVVTIFSGGSVGKEGPSAQVGAAAASSIATLFRFSDIDRKKMVICGISAGFASVFGTPMAGAVFGVEILLVGVLMYDVLLPSIISGFVAFYVTKLLGITYTYFEFSFFTLRDFDTTLMLKVILGGIFFGIVADFIITVFSAIKKYAQSLQIHYLMKSFIGGSILVILTLIVGEAYLGLGIDTMEQALSQKYAEFNNIAWYDFILKTLYTSITLAFGGSGGVITPIFYIGATSGNFFGVLIDSYVPLFAALGFVSVLAGTTNAPIAAMILTVELFGSNVLHYAALSIIIAFLMTGHRGVYHTQILSMKKSDALDVKLGRSVTEADVTHTTRFFKNIVLIVKKIRIFFNK